MFHDVGRARYHTSVWGCFWLHAKPWSRGIAKTEDECMSLGWCGGLASCWHRDLWRKPELVLKGCCLLLTAVNAARSAR